jgi:predicted dehydrogenase
MADQRTVGVGVVGLSAAGGWARVAHLPALAAVDGLELRGLATSTERTAEAASASFGVPGYSSVTGLAADPDIDLVVVAVKVPHHRELVLPVLDTGVATLVEWPFARTLAEAEEMTAAAGTARSFVGLQGRSSPAFRWLADVIRDGYVGEVLSVTVVASSTEWGSPVPSRGAYTLDRASGATMLTIAFGHAFDLVAMVVGEPRELVATTATRRVSVPLAETGRLVPMTAEDQIAVSGTLASGAVFSVHHRGGALSGAGFSMLVDGTEGRLEVTGPEFPHLGAVTVRGARGRAPLAPLALPREYDRFPRLAGSHIHTLAHAYAAVRDDLMRGTHAAPDFAHAVTRHRVLDAISRAAESGQRVSLAH